MIRLKDSIPYKIGLPFLTCSPSEQETQQVKAFSEKYEVEVKYQIRRNFGIDQGARVEYIIGKVDNLQEVLDTEYIFQFQEHYVDIKAPYSGEKNSILESRATLCRTTSLSI